MTVKTMLLSLIQLAWLATAAATPAPPDAAVPARGRSLTIPVRANPHHVPDGPAELAAAYRRWNIPVPEGLETHLLARREGYSAGIAPAASTANNDAWLSEIYIGKPDAQPVSVMIDTAVSDFWLFSTDTQFPKSIATASRPSLYDPSKSQASQELPGFSWNITDKDTSSASGKVYFDNLRIGQITDQNWFNITNATIQSAIDVTGRLAVDQTGLAGVLGIAKSGPSAIQPTMPTMMDRFKQDLHFPSICADLRHNSSLGFFSFGSSRGCVDSKSSVDEPPVPGSPHWDFNVARFRLTSMADGVWWSAPFSATVDTGSSLLLIPGNLVALYYAEIPGATFDRNLGSWLFPCNIASGIPDFEFATSGGFNGTLPKEYINVGPVPDQDGKCFGGIQSSGNDHGIFGGVVLKTLYFKLNFGDTGTFVSFGPKGVDVCSLTNTCKL